MSYRKYKVEPELRLVLEEAHNLNVGDIKILKFKSESETKKIAYELFSERRLLSRYLPTARDRVRIVTDLVNMEVRLVRVASSNVSG